MGNDLKQIASSMAKDIENICNANCIEYPQSLSDYISYIDSVSGNTPLFSNEDM